MFVNEGQDSSISNVMLQSNAIDSLKIKDGTITRTDVTANFKAPSADTADYAYGAIPTRPITPPVGSYPNEIANNAIDSFKVHDNAITDNKIRNGAISSYKIQNKAITSDKILNDAVTSAKILDGTITRTDVATNFKSPYSDTSDYARATSVTYVDSARIAVNAYNAYKLQGKDTTALSAKFVDEGQENSIVDTMIIDGAITSNKIKSYAVTNLKIGGDAVTSRTIRDSTITRTDVADTFKAPYSDTFDYAKNADKLQGKDTMALGSIFVREGQTDAISANMIKNDAVTSDKIQDGTIIRADVSNSFRAPKADTAELLVYNSLYMGIDTIYQSYNEDTIVKSGINLSNCLIFLTIGPAENSVQSIKINRISNSNDTLFVGTIDNHAPDIDIPYQYFIIPKP
jgi:hypothetical protein